VGVVLAAVVAQRQAHHQRDGAATKANVLLNLGWEDRLEPDGLSPPR